MKIVKAKESGHLISFNFSNVPNIDYLTENFLERNSQEMFKNQHLDRHNTC